MALSMGQGCAAMGQGCAAIQLCVMDNAPGWNKTQRPWLKDGAPLSILARGYG